MKIINNFGINYSFFIHRYSLFTFCHRTQLRFNRVSTENMRSMRINFAVSSPINVLISNGVTFCGEMKLRVETNNERSEQIQRSRVRSRNWLLITPPAESTVYPARRKRDRYSPLAPSISTASSLHNVAVQRLRFALSLLMRAGRVFFDLRSFINAQCEHENFIPPPSPSEGYYRRAVYV